MFVLVGFLGGGGLSKRIFHSFGKVTTTGEGLQIFTYMHTQLSLTLSSEGSFTCHTYFDKGQLFIMVIPNDP